jgi:uncharacterized membrane protein
MFIKLYFIALPVFFAIDMVWLALVARSFYRAQIGFLMGSDFNWFAAIVFYLLFISALIYFVISPAVEKKIWFDALLRGALFGLVSYATYDLTNQATIKGWPVVVTIVDIAWGTTLSASVSVVSYFIAEKVGL